MMAFSCAKPKSNAVVEEIRRAEEPDQTKAQQPFDEIDEMNPRGRLTVLYCTVLYYWLEDHVTLLNLNLVKGQEELLSHRKP